jgi:hypothetical protein
MKSKAVRMQQGYLRRLRQHTSAPEWLVASFETADGRMHEVATARVVLACGFAKVHRAFVPPRVLVKQEIDQRGGSAVPSSPQGELLGVVSERESAGGQAGGQAEEGLQRLGSDRVSAADGNKGRDLLPTRFVKGRPTNAEKSIPLGRQVEGEEIYLAGTTCGVDLVDTTYHVNGTVPIVELGQVEALAFTSVLTEEFGRVVAARALADHVCTERTGELADPATALPTLTVLGPRLSAATGCFEVGETEDEVLAVFREFVVQTQGEDVGASVVLHMAQLLASPSCRLALDEGLSVEGAAMEFKFSTARGTGLEVSCDGLSADDLGQVLVCLSFLPALVKRLLGLSFDLEHRLCVSLRFVCDEHKPSVILVDPVRSHVSVVMQ